MTATIRFSKGRRFYSALLVGTMLGGVFAPAYAQDTGLAPPTGRTPAPAPTPPSAPAPSALPAPVAVAPQGTGTIRSLAVVGNQRLEPETVLSYMKLRIGEAYTRERLDEALRDLYATELFADVQIAGAGTGDIVVEVRENPVINRIVLEGY